ncbi:hypothetical protein J4416_04580 [Candidatus Pacearchaeota archaeon]|nr:hypothetical protein [Candidatus Pacearchaeota archaeon]
MNKKEIIKKYGEKLLNEISEAGYLDGITVSINKDGEVDISEDDIIIAIKMLKCKKIENWEWD